MCGCTSSFGPDRYGPDYGARFAFQGKAPASMPWLAGTALDPNAPDPNCPTCRLGGTGRPVVMNGSQAQFAPQVVGADMPLLMPAGQAQIMKNPAVPTSAASLFVAHLNPQAFLAGINSGCAQWTAFNATLKQTLVRGWYRSHGNGLPYFSPAEVWIFRQRELGLPTSPVPAGLSTSGTPPFTADDVAQGVTKVEQYCAAWNAVRTVKPGRFLPAGQVFPTGVQGGVAPGWWNTTSPTNFDAAKFIAAIHTSCAQWASINQALKRGVMRGYVLGAIQSNALVFLTGPAGSAAQAIPPAMVNNVAWLDALIAAVDRYCAFQTNRANANQLAAQGYRAAGQAVVGGVVMPEQVSWTQDGYGNLHPLYRLG